MDELGKHTLQYSTNWAHVQLLRDKLPVVHVGKSGNLHNLAFRSNSGLKWPATEFSRKADPSVARSCAAGPEQDGRGREDGF